ncbi:MAG TPA: ABC transporter permease [Bryobacteraceae bacterium]|nr:ABC transporter permease [Bryobacteraceae bacterium]
MPLENWFYTVPLRLRSLFRRNRVEQDLEDEMQFHLEHRIEEELANGASPEDARFAALRAMDGLEFRKEQCRDARRVNLVEDLIQDLRYGARQLRHSPGFTVAAVLSLALGIGANTAIFQLLDAVRLRTLPVEAPQELVSVHFAKGSHFNGWFSSRSAQFTYSQWDEIRRRQQAFSGVLAWSADRFNLAPGGEVRYAQGLYVSGDFFRNLGVMPVLGRVFTSADDQPNCANPGVVLDYAFWQREFGGGTSVLSRTILLDGHTFPIVGVTPATFFGVEVGHRFDVAVPLCADSLIAAPGEARIPERTAWWLSIIGRLKPGWNAERASAHFQAISPTLAQATLPEVYRADSAKQYLANKIVATGAGNGVSGLRKSGEQPLLLLLAITGLVLLIACANLANLLLARASVREREIAVRLSIGASRARLVRQLLTESLLLAAMGAALGAGLAQAISRGLIALISTSADSVFIGIALDLRVLAFTGALAVATCALFGLAPALTATHAGPAAAMHTGGRAITPGRRRFGLRRALVTIQVALSLMLLSGALLFVRTLHNLMTLDPGFRSTGVLVADIDLARLGYNKERRTIVFRELRQRLGAQPGVVSSAQVAIAPVSGSGWSDMVRTNPTQEGKSSMMDSVSPGYFRTLEIAFLAGRDFDDRDAAPGLKVAIVNQAFARQFFGGQNPVGRTFNVPEDAGKPDTVYRIVGFVRNTKYHDLREDFSPIAYLPAAQPEGPPGTDTTFVLRAATPIGELMSGVKATVAQVNPAIQIEFHVLSGYVHDSLLRERLMATLSAAFGLLAALLATVGLYGVIAYMVARRRNEIGVRIALGAGPLRVIRLVLGEAVLLLGAGLVAGTALTLIASRAAASLLFGLKPYDPLTLIAAAALLAAVALAAAWVPARRAAALSPVTALREE